jgi:ribosomal silencing factor RsfS
MSVMDEEQKSRAFDIVLAKLQAAKAKVDAMVAASACETRHISRNA